MNAWAISDLHLSLARPDRRDRFADRWRDHVAKLEAGWRDAVRPGDLVLLPGDLSMARNHRELQPDLHWLESMPGRKVLAPGNHDAWWNKLAKVRPMMRASLRAVEATAEDLGDAIVAGARSMAVPRVDDPDAPVDDKAVARALQGLETALQAASALRKSPEQPLILLWHFPPFDAYGRPGPWVERFEHFQVTTCLYGHLHQESQWAGAVQGRHGNVRYQCVAADAVGFRPIRVVGV
ncbi:metallophosphoesterase [Planctomyces sp. SH-PL62]|uniref:metallophosphoesterase n=1 Tax=Planctomyces sp. SH-PL62 TaxID=1636152 RepID=UPI00078DA019|nr:metallophosphoesterase [Planctomyces sp. SH-PL62]AMV36798.1 Calcineurin-like phosphoesterase [Planctomyces sp. SH-PL62]